MQIETFDDIDWTTLRANALKRKGWRNKGPEDWDGKAQSFSSRNKSAAYVDLFLAHLPLDETMSVLDIGCGPGTLALPIAKKTRKVTAVDFSQGMLDVLKKQALEENIFNIETIHCSWEDNWHNKGIGQHDIAIASRALGIEDLQMALTKIHTIANKYVFLSDRIGTTPFDPDAFAAIGRPLPSGPDYIYTVNMLYSMGIHPNISTLTLEQECSFSSLSEAVKSYSWMFTDINDEETAALENFIQQAIIIEDNNRLVLRKRTPPRWALIWWEKTN